ncbi:excisionase family DNA binding protein [Saccharopolyspora erythraea NRRL 2338]|uniref:Probable excisionase n=3 Tax=Saccharopolyspora erythraea TaxID=1836 RepID=XIS_SACER|nr:helix-turn-helix domain-containing protein [Saccharopolyspora erythraea]P22876.1 RecName: Full=Probable excisionase [Saccharopolyspora erythraea]AAA98344.1 putative [Plasmid pSE211]EQD84363.1 excisionase [Saccharopolyspora erythraea D]PFG92792.1 excisionase family DNA binding protein [Saccharopolyspora erythraea NRRL 2338]PFG99838.1 excisionase family DNA binding protein [Saccharopolyspora erythraea NRRL 2338]QRK89708.1 helix-turn-helix domain-containing protein [Saccharopolyspora erythrae
MTTNVTQLAATLASLAALLAEQQPAPEPEPEPAARRLPNRVLLTVEEAAKQLGLGRTKTYALVASGEIESVRIGRLRRIPRTAIDDYAARLIAQQSAA